MFFDTWEKTGRKNTTEVSRYGHNKIQNWNENQNGRENMTIAVLPFCPPLSTNRPGMASQGVGNMFQPHGHRNGKSVLVGIYFLSNQNQGFSQRFTVRF